MMITVVIIGAAILVLAVGGLIVILRAGIAREDADHSLRGEPVTLASAITRRLVGLHVRMPRPPSQPVNPPDAEQSSWPSDRGWPHDHCWPDDSAD
jgi:hypothetical protein